MIAKSDPNRSARQPLHDKCLPRATSCVSSRARGQPDEETVIPGIDTQYPIKSHKCEDIKAYIEDDFAEEIEKTATISALSPDLGQQTRAVLEARKAFCLADLDEGVRGLCHRRNRVQRSQRRRRRRCHRNLRPSLRHDRGNRKSSGIMRLPFDHVQVSAVQLR
jgi:hypothetical protein